MKKLEIRDKSVVLKWIVIVLCVGFLLVLCAGYIYKAVTQTEWYHLRMMKKAFENEYVHVNEDSQILTIGISPAGQDDSWKYSYDIPETLFDDMTCNEFKEIEDEEKIEEILSYDWIMVTFRDASKSMYFISPQDEIYWGTSIQVKCPSLLNWYKEQMQN